MTASDTFQHLPLGFAPKCNWTTSSVPVNPRAPHPQQSTPYTYEGIPQLHEIDSSSEVSSEDSSSQTSSEEGYTDNTSPLSSHSSDSAPSDLKNNSAQDSDWRQCLLGLAAEDRAGGGKRTGDDTNEGQHALPVRSKDGSSFARPSLQHGQNAQVCPQLIQPANSAVSHKFNARRRTCVANALVPPPKLRRDTDCTDAIVKLIVVFCTYLLQAYWPVPTSASQTPTSFSASRVLPLQIFITETLRRSRTSYSTLQVALYYLILLRSRLPKPQGSQESGASGCRALQCGRRMFLTALILASKYLQDRNYSARAWSKISGLPLKEINENERHYLSVIEFDLHVPKNTFENWSKIVLAICKLSGGNDSDHHPPGSSISLVSPTQQQQQLQLTCDDAPAAHSWWSSHLRRLSPGMVRDVDETEKFLASISPYRPASEAWSRILDDSIRITCSPEEYAGKPSEAGPQTVRRVPSMDLLSQCYESLGRAGSPASTSVASIPPQPMLRNLPTPQTTPRFDANGPWPSSSCHPNPRCRASMSALGSVGKHHIAAANLETCPPPQPRSYAQVPSSSVNTWREPNTGSASSITSSPESVVSDVSSTSTGSRASSNSSINSFCPPFIRNKASCQDLRLRTEMARCGQSIEQRLGVRETFNHCAFTVAGKRSQDLIRRHSAFEDEGIVISERTLHNRARLQTMVRLVDEGYGSDGYGLPEAGAKEKEVAQALVFLASHGVEQAKQSVPAAARLNAETTSAMKDCTITRPSKKHKRAPSKASDVLQQETRRLLIDEKCASQVQEDPWLCDYAESQEKNVQHGTQEWAFARKPVPVGMQNKRFAQQQSGYMHASNLASEYLATVSTCV